MTSRDQTGLQLNWWISKKLGHVDRSLGKRWRVMRVAQNGRSLQIWKYFFNNIIYFIYYSTTSNFKLFVALYIH